LVAVYAEADGWLRLTIANLNSRSGGAGILAGGDLEDASQRGITDWRRIGPGGSKSLGPIAVSGGCVYFLRLSPQETALAVPLRIECQLEPLPADSDRCPIATAGMPCELPVGAGRSIEATVGFGRNNEDWYRVKAPSAGVVKFTLENLCEPRVANGMLAPLLIRLHGDEFKTHPIGPKGKRESRQYTVSQGDELLVRVQPQQNKPHAAMYRLTCSLDPMRN